MYASSFFVSLSEALAKFALRPKMLLLLLFLISLVRLARSKHLSLYMLQYSHEPDKVKDVEDHKESDQIEAYDQLP